MIMPKNRREILKIGASGAIGAAFLASPFSLNIAQSSANFIEIRAQKTQKSLVGKDGPLSDLWLYNGLTPGPEIRIKQGERVFVRLINELDEPTTIHWHGIRIDNKMDGVPGLTQQAVMPGEIFEYDFLAPDAGTYYYHSHNKTWSQVARGLYGVLIVEEKEEIFDKDHDLTLVIDDWRIGRDGRLDLASLGSMMDWSHGGRLGNLLTVNSQNVPVYQLKAGENYRLRLLNVANSRILEIDPNRFDAKILAYDGQSIGEAQNLQYSPLLLGPAQRVDLLVTPKMGGDFSIEELSIGEPFPFVNFEIIGEEPTKPNKPTIKTLPLNKIPEPDIANAKSFLLKMSGGAMRRVGDIYYQGKKLSGEDFRKTGQVWAFNGVANLPKEPFFSVKQGETIIIETLNDTNFIHAMHVHGFHFRVIERSHSDIDESHIWRDTFLIGADQRVKIAFVADNPGKWLYHCHMLEHAAAGMITWFEVI